MNIQGAGYDISRSIQEMGNLLKNMTSEKMDMENKMMKVTVTEQVTDPDKGQKIDLMA